MSFILLHYQAVLWSLLLFFAVISAFPQAGQQVGVRWSILRLFQRLSPFAPGNGPNTLKFPFAAPMEWNGQLTRYLFQELGERMPPSALRSILRATLGTLPPEGTDLRDTDPSPMASAKTMTPSFGPPTGATLALIVAGMSVLGLLTCAFLPGCTTALKEQRIAQAYIHVSYTIGLASTDPAARMKAALANSNRPSRSAIASPSGNCESKPSSCGVAAEPWPVPPSPTP